MENQLLSKQNSEVSDILEEFRKYVEKYIKHDKDLVHEILVQALYELNSPRVGNDKLQHLKICYENLVKRAKAEIWKSTCLLKRVKASDICNVDLCRLIDNKHKLSHDYKDYIEEICKILTPKQLEIFEFILDNDGMAKSEIRESLGYGSESGFRQMLNRIELKIRLVIEKNS
jgi:hypothetical protein